MKKPELFIHVGIHKTGTTSIQHFFHRNYNELLKKGVLYPKSLRKIENGLVHFAHHDFAWSFGFSGNDSRLDNKSDFSKRLMNEFIRTNSKCIFISSEAFEYVHSKNSLEKLKKEFKDFDVKIIMYIRRQDKLLQSVYKQRVKTGFTVEFNKFFRKSNFNYEEKISFWEQFFGQENIIIKLFDDPEIKSNLIGNLLNDLGVDDIKGFSEDEFTNKNESFSNEHTLLISQLNAYTNSQMKGEIFKFFKEYYGEIKPVFSDDSFLTKKQLKIIFNRHKKSNESLRNKYYPEREQLFNWNLEEELKSHKSFNYKNVPDLMLDTFVYLLRNKKDSKSPKTEEDDI